MIVENPAEHVTQDLNEQALGALYDLARTLRLLSDSRGDLRVEARQAWLLARMPLDTYADIYRALEFTGVISNTVDNWRDCVVPKETADGRRLADLEAAIRVVEGERLREFGESEDTLRALISLRMLRDAKEAVVDAEDADLHTRYVDPVRRAAEAALDALTDLVDAEEKG